VPGCESRNDCLTMGIGVTYFPERRFKESGTSRMAPHESKPKDRVFELANPAAGPNPGSRGEDSQETSTDITVRLCRGEQGNPIPPLTWRSESVLVFMIEDLVLASRGRVADESPTAMTAHFQSSAQALVAAQRIQGAIQEFLACRPGDYVGAAILIHPPIAPSSGFSSDRMQAELRLAQPGQILLSGDISRRLQNHPGLQLRAIPALTIGGREQEGLSELVPVAVRPIEQNPPSHRGSAQPGEESPPMGATMMVNAPFGSARAQASQPLRPGDGTSESGSLGRAEPGRDISSTELLAEFEERPFIKRPLVLVGAAAVLVIGLLVAVFYPHKAKPQVADHPSQPQTSETRESQTNETGSASATQQTVGSTDSSGANPTEEKKPIKPIEKHLAKKKPVETPDEQQIDEVFDGMTRNEIPTLLTWAKRDAGNGDYEKAKREYRAVLRLDPSNSEAKDGLRRLELAQGHDR